jgi:hypothetical protein
MSYFKTIPSIYYPFDIKGEINLGIIKDIALNVRVKKEVLDNVVLFDEYFIANGDRPEVISQKLYGSSQYHWVIMLVNLRFDYLNDFPLREDVLNKNTYLKYRVNPEDVIEIVLDTQIRIGGDLLYWDENGNPTDPTYWDNETSTWLPKPFITPVTHEMYETAINDAKKNIRVINPRLISQVVEEIDNLFLLYVDDNQ